jgi:8-oxo-dGTP diphosphatase
VAKKPAKKHTKNAKSKAAKKLAPRKRPPRRVVAAGAALWRPDEQTGEPLIAVIHRPRYNDWSLPKGKLDPGENEPVAAVREIWEETGQHARLGRRLSEVSYPIPEGTKTVHYRVARSLGGDFAPNSEVDEMLWLPVREASEKLTYGHDREVLARFAQRPVDTQTVLIVRHGTAGIKSRYKGDDRKRPLDKNGRAQAEALVGQLMAFGATDVFSADRTRCIQTVEPLAQELGVKIVRESSLTEESYKGNPAQAHSRALEIAALGRIPVICTQGKVIPHLLRWWCERDGLSHGSSGNRKGSTSILTLAQGRLIDVDYIASPLSSDV